ncbi:MAG TPA: RNA polymerase subunit sigma-24 [Verrucomicrobiales bacterium]|nr:RNA polymerase subunit sigma-24 [Verrucomicrobiales bacterium]
MKPATHPGAPVFDTTRWSVIASAGSADAVDAGAALESLCTTYWTPVYAYARCLGNAPEDALDLTQGFFEKVIAGNFFAQADRTRGRFRSFLLTSLKHYIFKEHARQKAERRGGRVQFVPLEQRRAETTLRIEPVDHASPDKAFDKEWALALLDAVMKELETYYAGQGGARLFETLQPCLAAGRDRHSYAELARSTGLSEGAVKVAVHRMRRRYRELLRRRVADTVDSEAETEAELRHLLAALAGK